MLNLQYIRRFKLSINVAEKIGLLTVFCCFKLYDICIDKTNYLIYIVSFSIFFYYPKFISYIPNFILLRKFIIRVIVTKFSQMKALFYSRVAKMFFILNYNFYEATKLFIINGNSLMLSILETSSWLQIFFIKRCLFSITKPYQIFYLSLPIWCEPSISSKKSHISTLFQRDQ